MLVSLCQACSGMYSPYTGSGWQLDTKHCAHLFQQQQQQQAPQHSSSAADVQCVLSLQCMLPLCGGMYSLQTSNLCLRNHMSTTSISCSSSCSSSMLVSPAAQWQTVLGVRHVLCAQLALLTCVFAAVPAPLTLLSGCCFACRWSRVPTWPSCRWHDGRGHDGARHGCRLDGRGLGP